jgi:hypothetical protein
MHKKLQKTSKVDEKFDYRMTYISFVCAQGKLKTSRRTDLKKQSQFVGLWPEILDSKSYTLNEGEIMQNKPNFTSRGPP